MNRTESSLELGPLPGADFESGPKDEVPIPPSATVETDLSAQQIPNPDFQPLAGGEGGNGSPGCFLFPFVVGRVLYENLKKNFNK